MDIEDISLKPDSKLNAVDAIEQFWLAFFNEDVNNIFRFTDLERLRSNKITPKTVYQVNHMMNEVTGSSDFVSLKTLDQYGKSSKAQLANWIKGGGPEFDTIMQHAEFIDKAAGNLGDQTKLTLHELQDQLQNYAKHLGFLFRLARGNNRKG